MKPSVYIETTIPSLLTAWPNRDVEIAAQQVATREWWEKRRHAFDLYVSADVLDEAERGDADAARLHRTAARRHLPDNGILFARPLHATRINVKLPRAMKNKNPIEEVWRIREEIGAEHGYDVDRLFAAMREKEKQYGDRLVRVVPPRHMPEQSTAVLREEPPKAE